MMGVPTALVLLAWLAMAALGVYALKRYLALMDQGGRPHAARPVVVITAVKGVGPDTNAFLDRLLAQDHPNARFIFAVESEADPVHALLLARQAATPRPIEILVAGLSVDEGQKVANLRAALGLVRPDDAIVAFADADILPKPDWLSHLDWAVIDAKQPIVSGYRLIVPRVAGLGGSIVASLDLSILGGARPTRAAIVWGGTWALAPETIEGLRLKDEVWRGALSDDVGVGRAARAAGIPVMTERRLTVETPWRGGTGRAWEFLVRQCWMVRRARPGLFFAGLPAIALPVAGAAAALLDIAAGGWMGWATFAALVLVGEYRWRVRRAVVQRVVGAERMADLSAWLAFDRFARPLYWPVLLAAMLVAAVKPTITWAGVTYASPTPNATRVLKRVTPASGRSSAG